LNEIAGRGADVGQFHRSNAATERRQLRPLPIARLDATPPAVIARLDRASIPERAVMGSRSRGVLDTPLEPIIGLAEGETGGGV
jgi:hypothetical protein